MKALAWILKRYLPTVALARLDVELNVELDLRASEGAHGRPSPNQASLIVDLVPWLVLAAVTVAVTTIIR